jgi:membrane dipeptidase
MQIIDTHCDALFQLQQAKQGKLESASPIRFQDSQALHVNVERMKAGHVKVQFFAIFIDSSVPSDQKLSYALEQIDLFHQEVLQPNPEMKWITKWEQINFLKEGERGAVLTLEGGEAFGDDFAKLRTLYRLGVLSIGLTWNDANLLADGANEPRGAGLTLLGKEVVRANHKQGVLTDVSHLSERGFWDVMDLTDTVLASHSNVRALCDHPRNLTDEQIRALIQKNGRIHVVFNPPFIKENSETATIHDLIQHIDHICSLGGEKHLGFGSDFDGITKFVQGLEHAGKYQNLINELLRYYSEETVKGFAYQNFLTWVNEI